MRGQPDPPCNLCQDLARDQHGESARQIAFLLFREPAIEQIGDDQAENTVAEEFQAFIGGATATRSARMRERKLQQQWVVEAVAEHLGQLVQGLLAPGRHSTALNSRDQRMAVGQRHTSHSAALPSTEKNRISARPTRFSAGMV